MFFIKYIFYIINKYQNSINDAYFKTEFLLKEQSETVI